MGLIRTPFARNSVTACLITLGAGLVSGCSGGIGETAALAAGTVAVVINNDKLPTDYIAEAVTGLDCNSVRKSVDKGPLCRHHKEEIVERPVYCYRTLGTITCYNEKDPYGTGQQQVN